MGLEQRLQRTRGSSRESRWKPGGGGGVIATGWAAASAAVSLHAHRGCPPHSVRPRRLVRFLHSSGSLPPGTRALSGRGSAREVPWGMEQGQP